MTSEKNRAENSLPGSLDRGGLEDLLGFQLRRAQLKLFQHFKDSMQDPALTPGQAGVLLLIETNPGISQSALARALEIERASLGETIVELQRRKWIERRRSQTDGRSLALYLSVMGKKSLEKIRRGIEKHEKELTRTLTGNERRQLMHLLLKFNKA